MKLTYLLTALAISLAPANAQFKPDFNLKPDDFTVLMGVDADLSAGLNRVSHSSHGKFQVSGWTRADQAATWKVTATKTAPYEVFALVKRANNQPLAFKLDAAGQSLHDSLPANPYSWQRVKLDGALNLPAGESTITLHIAAADGITDFNAELHAIELVQPNVLPNSPSAPWRCARTRSGSKTPATE